MAGINGAKYKLMPSSPEANLKDIEESAKKVVEEFDGDSVIIGVNYPGERVLKKLKEMYIEAGWNVKYESDQRDGDYLLITPRRKR